MNLIKRIHHQLRCAKLELRSAERRGDNPDIRRLTTKIKGYEKYIAQRANDAR